MEKYAALESKNDRLNKQYSITKDELSAANSENKRLMEQNKQLKGSISNAEKNIERLNDELQQLSAEYAAAKKKYEETTAAYMAQLTGKNNDLSSTRLLLEEREKELNEKESRLEVLQKEYEERKERMDDLTRKLEEKEQELKKALEEKERAINEIRQKVANALVGFENKGLKIEVKDGKVYVSMEDKLLFASGSWTVSAEGMKAITELSKILEENTDINVMVEGHTDNVAYRGKSEVKDNWDLSVMRATAIVKALLKNSTIEPGRITASGRGEYVPKVDNSTKENRAVNRRTEIILTPKYVELLDILSK
jgi:chemotaxis protein MotB